MATLDKKRPVRGEAVFVEHASMMDICSKCCNYCGVLIKDIYYETVSILLHGTELSYSSEVGYIYIYIYTRTSLARTKKRNIAT